MRITIRDPSLPLGPVRILGQPWSVEVADPPFPDEPEFISYAYRERCQIVVSESLAPHGQAFQLWVQIWRALYRPLVWGKGEMQDAEQNAVVRAMWAALRDNAAAVATWFGWLSGVPEVPESPIRVLGQPWSLKRVHRIPGYSVDNYGLEHVSSYTLYVRDDLAPSFAAEVALHELTHAAVKPISPVGQEEAFVQAMAAGLAQVFFDNPGAMATMFGVEAEADEVSA